MNDEPIFENPNWDDMPLKEVLIDLIQKADQSLVTIKSFSAQIKAQFEQLENEELLAIMKSVYKQCLYVDLLIDNAWKYDEQTFSDPDRVNEPNKELFRIFLANIKSSWAQVSDVMKSLSERLINRSEVSEIINHLTTTIDRIDDWIASVRQVI